ncbi:hypothetical protein CHARACLAT_011570 [Characodon lateralis]|uniref:Uncharacterized protein n=1 Tax=Characodon lateralis TaxID=208331 RepID=A0ABU7EJM8_9TELE|nr:hypothetical protein [Characodon lateralis]
MATRNIYRLSSDGDGVLELKIVVNSGFKFEELFQLASKSDIHARFLSHLTLWESRGGEQDGVDGVFVPAVTPLSWAELEVVSGHTRKEQATKTVSEWKTKVVDHRLRSVRLASRLDSPFSPSQLWASGKHLNNSSNPTAKLHRGRPASTPAPATTSPGPASAVVLLRSSSHTLGFNVIFYSDHLPCFLHLVHGFSSLTQLLWEFASNFATSALPLLCSADAQPAPWPLPLTFTLATLILAVSNVGHQSALCSSVPFFQHFCPAKLKLLASRSSLLMNWNEGVPMIGFLKFLRQTLFNATFPLVSSQVTHSESGQPLQQLPKEFPQLPYNNSAAAQLQHSLHMSAQTSILCSLLNDLLALLLGPSFGTVHPSLRLGRHNPSLSKSWQAQSIPLFALAGTVHPSLCLGRHSPSLSTPWQAQLIPLKPWQVEMEF